MLTSVWSRTLLRCALALPLFAFPAQGFLGLTMVQPVSPATFGAPLTLVANITPASITGNVVFYDGVNVLGFGAINSGQATLTTIALSAGTHKLHAYHALAGLTSATVTETVNAVSGGGFSAAASSPFSVGTSPYSVATADFNHDGFADMAVLNQTDHTVSILLGNGAGGFTVPAGSPFTTVSIPRALAVGDFDGDGNPDLAIGGGGLSSSVTILLGNGSGGFSASTGSPFSTGGFAVYSMAVADFNGDGKTDLAIGTGHEVLVLMGNGDGTFQAAVSYLSGSYKSASVAVGDFNGDGKADLAFASATGSSASVVILIGNGTGTFTTAASPFGFGSASTVVNSIITGDFNGDGNWDLAVADNGGNTVIVILGDGSGAFTMAPNSPFAVDGAANALATGDFNGDGIPDLAIATSAGLEIRIGAGNGFFSEFLGGPYAAGTTPFSVAVADFDGDGRADLAVANNGSSNVSVFLASPSVGISLTASPNPSIFGRQVTLTAAVRPSASAGSITFLDGVIDLGSAPIVSGQAVLKIIALAPGQHSLHAVYVNPSSYQGSVSNTVSQTVNPVAAFGDSPPSSGPVPAGTAPSAVVTGDFNNDGMADLAVTNKSDNTVSILLGNGNGGFTAPSGSPFPAGTNPLAMAVGDFNGDGNTDLVITSGNSGGVTVLLGNGAGSFAAASGSPFANPGNLRSVVVADFNGDGIADLAISGTTLALHTIVFVGNGNGTFTPSSLPSSQQPTNNNAATTFFAVGDLNGDGAPDLAVIPGNNAPVVSLWEGSTLGFVNYLPSSFVGGVLPGIIVGDFNGDGKADVAFASSAFNQVRVFLGDGTGINFTQPSTSPFSTGATPKSMVTGDFNGDGKPDLAVANSGDGTVSIFLGDGAGNFSQMTGSPFQVGGTPVSLAVADFNRDGRMDIAVANSGTNNVNILLGQGPAPQTITFAPLPNIPVTTAPFDLTATSTSGMTVSFASSTPNMCGVSGSTVTILISGGCAIVASQAGGGQWQAAPSVTQKFTVLYNDVDSSVPAPQIAAIDLFAQYGITNGCGNNDFCPDLAVTRAQMAIFVIRSIFGGNTFPYSTTAHFTDVAPADFGFQYIQAMYELGITKGCSNVGGLLGYCPNASVTRLQMAVFIIRARFGSAAVFNYPSTAYFTDVLPPSVDPTDINYGYVQRMKLEAITSGCTATAYCPNDPVTRAQMAIFVMRALFNQELPANTPLVTQISPATLSPGTSNTFTITGINTSFQQGTTALAAIPGVTTGTITVNSATSLTVQLTADANAGARPYTIDAITGSQEAVLPNGFSVQ